MFGIILSVFSALLFAFGDVGKKILSKDIHPFQITWIPVNFGILIGLIYYGFNGIDHSNTLDILPWAVLSGLLLLVVELVFLKSISSGELSLIMPLTAFVPVFSGTIAWFFHAESPTYTALLGVSILLIGSWLMFADTSDWRNIFRPFARMFQDVAARYMLYFCAIDAVFVNVMNHGGDLSSAPYFLWLTLICESIFLSIILAKNKLNPLYPIKKYPAVTLGTGLAWSLGMLAVFESLTHTLIAYSMASNRVHTIFIVLLGYLIFKEQDFKKRILTSILMVIGVFILILGS